MFLDATADFCDEIFGDVPFFVSVISQYSVLRQDATDKLEEAIDILKSDVKEKNNTRLKLISAYEHAVALAEKQNFERSMEIIKARTSNSPLDLMTLANSLKESVLGRLDILEGQVADVTKSITEKGSDFFRTAEDVLRNFGSGLLASATQDLENFAQGTHPLSDTPLLVVETEAEKETARAPASIQPSSEASEEVKTNDGMSYEENAAAALANRDGMLNAVSNFTERQTSLSQNKEDFFSSQVANWRRDYFAAARERVSLNYQLRVLEIPKV